MTGLDPAAGTFTRAEGDVVEVWTVATRQYTRSVAGVVQATEVHLATVAVIDGMLS